MPIKNQFGLTMLELIIWIGIFGLLTSTMVSNFRGGGRNDAVRQAAALGEGLLRRAQTMTLTGAVLGNGDFPNGGWGVRFDTAQSGKLIFFADIDGNFRYDGGEAQESDSVNLPANTVFSLGSNLDIVFAPPSGDVYFNGLTAPGTANIPFSSLGASVTKSITVFRLSGQIRVE